MGAWVAWVASCFPICNPTGPPAGSVRRGERCGTQGNVPPGPSQSLAGSERARQDSNLRPRAPEAGCATGLTTRNFAAQRAPGSRRHGRDPLGSGGVRLDSGTGSWAGARSAFAARPAQRRAAKLDNTHRSMTFAQVRHSLPGRRGSHADPAGVDGAPRHRDDAAVRRLRPQRTGAELIAAAFGSSARPDEREAQPLDD
jgi:hypothetical protein